MKSRILWFLFLAVACTSSGYKIDREIAAAKDPIQACLDRLRTDEVLATQAREEEQRKKDAEKPPDQRARSLYSFKTISGWDLPYKWNDMNLVKYREAIVHQMANCKKEPIRDVKEFRFGCRVVSRDEWCTQTNTEILQVIDAELAKAKAENREPSLEVFGDNMRERFVWYKSKGLLDSEDLPKGFNVGDVQFTAYYSPHFEAEAHRKKDAVFKYPIYKRPKDLVDGGCGEDPLTHKKYKYCRVINKKGKNPVYTTYYTKREIDGPEKVLAGKKLEIAYVHDRVEVYDLMMEGSGSIAIDGKISKLNFASTNGRTRHMLGRIIKCDLLSKACPGASPKEKSCLEKIDKDKRFFKSNFGIREYLANMSEERRDNLISYDQSYVFYSEEQIGPFGEERIPITEFYSVASDRESFVPMGANMLICVQRPGATGDCTMAIAQDVGGAIKGAHLDWYMGEGKEAGVLANAVNNPGAVYVALPSRSGRIIDGCDESKQ